MIYVTYLFVLINFNSLCSRNLRYIFLWIWNKDDNDDEVNYIYYHIIFIIVKQLSINYMILGINMCSIPAMDPPPPRKTPNCIVPKDKTEI